MCWCVFQGWRFEKSQSRPALDELHAQIDWYHCASVRARICYSLAKLVEFVAAATIPIIAISDTEGTRLKIWAVILGSIVTLSASLQGGCQWHSKWLSWRSTWQDLINERILFEAKTGPYKEDETQKEDPVKILAKRLCDNLKKEFTDWRVARSSAGTTDNRTKDDDPKK